MKKIFFVVLFSIPLLCLSQNSQFDKGFYDGFKQGYCYSYNGYCSVTPIPPYPPLPNINESSTNYMDGYNKGFLVGKQKYDYENIPQTGHRNIYPDYVEPQSPITSNSYVSPLDLGLMQRVLAYKQKLFDTRADWVQEQIDNLSELNYSLLSRSNPTAYNRINNDIQSLLRTLNQRGGVDFTNNSLFNQVANFLSIIRNSIFNSN